MKLNLGQTIYEAHQERDRRSRERGEATKVLIEDISVGDRRREEFGDISALADSITRYGLLQPIVVDDQLNLVAGERRLRAVRKLGWEQIDARRIDDLEENELRELELEENIRRKSLTPYERSKTMVELLAVAADADRADSEKTDLCSTVEHKSARGRPGEPGSLRRAAQRSGLSLATGSRAKTHVAAGNDYPEIKAPGISQKDGLTIAKNLDALPDKEREAARERLRQGDSDTITTLAEKPPMPKDSGPVQEEVANMASTRWDKAMGTLHVRISGILSEGADQLVAEWRPHERQKLLGRVRVLHTQLGEALEQLEQAIAKLGEEDGA